MNLRRDHFCGFLYGNIIFDIMLPSILYLTFSVSATNTFA